MKFIVNIFQSLHRTIVPFLGSVESHFPKLKTHLEEMLVRHIDEKIKKIKEDPEFKEKLLQLKSELSQSFDESVSISYQKDCPGMLQGRPHLADKVVVSVTREFDSTCHQEEVYVSSLFQEAAAKHIKNRGFDVKNFSPAVSCTIVG
ncbi:MAG: hypothetical protein MRY79_02160 [Alphaproteobacteria bacterium]|nr:hypothetical protein [Alphaproteobacteria bacterium]